MSVIDGVSQTAETLTDRYQNVLDVQTLNDLKAQARLDQKAALRPVAEQFEALFLQQILKEARKVDFNEGFLQSSSTDFYQQWRDQELTQGLSSKGLLGLADKIVEQLTPELNVSSGSEPEVAKKSQPPEKAPIASPTEHFLRLKNLK